MKTLCIITRCHPARPGMTEKCIASVKNQSCDDYQHLLLQHDKTEKGYGVEEANKSLHGVEGINGHYVMVLDDDDMLIDGRVVRDIVNAVKDNPDVVMFKGVIDKHGILPPIGLWEQPPVRGKIGSFCFAVSKQYWDAYCRYWASSEGYPAMGDYTFINACYKNAKKVVWLDRVMAITQNGANRGKSEPKPKGE